MKYIKSYKLFESIDSDIKSSWSEDYDIPLGIFDLILSGQIDLADSLIRGQKIRSKIVDWYSGCIMNNLVTIGIYRLSRYDNKYDTVIRNLKRMFSIKYITITKSTNDFLLDGHLDEFLYLFNHLSNVVFLRIVGEFDELPSYIKNLKNIKGVDLERCECEFGEFPLILLEMENLTSINIVGYRGIESLPDDIDKLNKLQFLTIDYCSLSKLPDSFSNLKDLQMLSIKGNRFKEFPKQVFDLPLLTDLYMLNNPLVELPVDDINKSNLLYLSLSGKLDFGEIKKSINLLVQ